MKLLISILVSLTTMAASAIAPGSEIIDFQLTNQDGKVISTRDFKGKYIVLEWYNHGCPFVRKHYDSKNMQRTQDYTLEKSNSVWLTINSSNIGNQGYIENPQVAKEKLRIENSRATHFLIDTNGKVGKMYHAKTTPEIFIINPKGKVIYMGAIDSIPSTDSADIAKANNYVKEVFTKIAAGESIQPRKTKPYGCSVKY